MKKTIKAKGCLIIFFVLIVGLGLLWNRCSRRNLINENFSGIVESIEYSSKNTPSVKIKDQMYVIPGIKGDVLIGDSLVKRAKSTVIYQYRNGEYINEYSW